MLLLKVICFTWVSLFLMAPVFAGLDAPHDAGHNISCSSCHDTSLADSPLLTGSNINNFCTVNCHNAATSPYSNTSAPIVLGHTSENTSAKYGTWSKQCIDCHDPHYQYQKARIRTEGAELILFSGQIDAYAYESGNDISVLTYSGGAFKSGWDIDSITEKTTAARRPILLPNLRKTGNAFAVTAIDATTMTVAGDVRSMYTYISPPTNFGVIYGQYIKRLVDWNNTPDDGTDDATVKFSDRQGDNSFADGDAIYDGICEVCHTMTDHFRNDGSGPDQNHTNAGAVTSIDCISCHAHTQGFAHGIDSQGPGCEPCHGHDPGYGGATGGAGSFWSHSTHTENDSDDLKGPNVGCDTCHDTANFPDFADGASSLLLTTVCDTCHSQGGTYDGVSDAVVGAKNNWDTAIYESDSVTLQAGKDKWCATCHDEAPSVASAISAPNVIGDEDGDYTYGVGTGWGYYKTGHGLDSADTYPASGGVVQGAGKGCDDCHDYSAAHIDGVARSFDCTDADPANDIDQNDRDCDSDEYRLGYRLNLVDDLNPMVVPLTGVTPNQDEHRLCFSSNGCHLPDKYLTKSTEYGTTFRDDLDWNPTGPDPAPVNAHEYHLGMQYRFRSDWRSTTGKNTITCINCHNVHGSTQLSMIRDGKLTGKEPGMKIFYTDMVVGSPSVSYVTTRDVVEPSQPIYLPDSTGTFWDSNTSDNLCSDCHGNATGGGYIYPRSSNPIAQEAPTLAWTGEAGYTTDGVSPDSAQSGNYFAFRVEYTDANRDRPTVIQVWVDVDDSGSYAENEKFTMFDVDDSDHDSSDGKLYTRIMALNSVGDGTLSYRFHAMDRNGTATGSPVTGATITLNPDVPVLAWSGEAGYSADGVSPNSGASGSSFVFQIDYSHADNLLPSNIQVWVDVDDSGSYEPGEKYEMTEVDSGDTTLTDSKLYSKTLALAYAGDGSLNYRFYALRDALEATGTPTTDRSVNVTSSNTAPLLTWTGVSNYVTDGVDPDSGLDNSSFSFQVQYSDADNTTPTAIQLWVDRNDDDDYDDSDEKIDLTVVDASDTDYSDGKMYVATTTLLIAGDGVINYRFFASDGSVDAGGIAANDNIVTLFVNTIKVSCDGTGDYDYTSLQTAINNAANGDTLLLADGTCTEKITIDNKDLTIISENGAASSIIDGNASGSTVTIKNGADTVLNGVTVQNGNQINFGKGGGLYISDSSPAIINSIITNNIGNSGGGGIYVIGASSTVTISATTISSNTAGSHGAGIYLDSGSSADISGSTISNNHSGNRGGGIFMATSADASLAVSSSTISGNSGTNFAYGGGIYCNATGGTVIVSIDDSTISGNSAQNGGGVYLESAGATLLTGSISDSTFSSNTSSTSAGGAIRLVALDSMTISGSTFNDNDGRTGGGGVAVVNGAGNTFTLIDSSIRDNSSAFFAKGGGLLLSGGTATIERSFFTGNSSQYGGGAYVDGNTTASFVNSVVSGNKGDYNGGGFHFSGEDVVLAADILNCTISGNTSNSGSAVEVAFDATATVTLTNSIIWGNGSSSQINGTVTASYSDIGEDGYSGNNNINIDPYFVDPLDFSYAPTSEGDYHLPNHSAAVDAGTATGAPASDIENNIRPNGAGIDMGAYEVGTVFNNIPSLEWTGETNYAADGVDPDQGVSGASFEFRTTYVDADNDAPVAIQLWVDENDNGSYEAGEKYTMSAVDGGDITYTDGKLYSKSLNLVYAGDDVLNYRFYAADTYDLATGEPVTDNTVVLSSVPQLAWLGSGDYVTDGAHPDSGFISSDFVFQVSYTDAHNTPPTSIQVWLDRNDDGDYLDSGETLTMTEISSADTDCTDGKIYTRTVNFFKAGDNTLNYRFYAANGVAAIGDPVTTTTSSVTIANHVPTLDWTGLLNYVSDGVDPNNDEDGSLFDFRIKYTDADNEAPASIQLWLDKNDDSDYLDVGEKVDLSAVDGGDSDYTDGKLYKVAINLNSAGDNNLNYSFRAGDGTDAATGDPTSDSTVGIFAASPPPDLDWTGESGYTIDGVEEESGPCGGLYTFRVQYTQLLNTAPVTIQLWVDKNDDGDYLDGGEKIDLTVVDGGDSDYTDGKLYTISTLVPYVADGGVAYLFYANDGTADANGNAIVEQTLTVVDAVEVPSEAATIQAGINAAADGQCVLVSNGTYSERIVFPTTKSVTVQSVYGAATTTIQGDGTNGQVVDISSGAHSAVLDGFTIDNQGSVITNSNTRGILVDSLSAPLIKNCIIQGNQPTGSGGGIYLLNASTTTATTLLNINVIGNTAQYGAGIRCDNSKLAITSSSVSSNTTTRDGGGIYLSGASSTVTITDSNIDNNTVSNTAYSGGGIFLDDNTAATISGGSSINGNTAGSGGAVYADAGSTLTISDTSIDSNGGTYGGAIRLRGTVVAALTNVSVSSNTSTQHGGAVYSADAGTSLVITNSTINDNIAATVKNGGALYIQNGSAEVNSSLIQGNKAGAYGGAIRNLGGTVTLTNCIVSGNIIEANDGGGIYCGAGTLNVYNTTISGNYSANRGGGLYGIGTIINSVIWGNTAGGTGPNISGTPTVTYSDVEGGYAGTGNIDANPEFVDFQQAGSGSPTTAGDFRICNGADNPAGCTNVSPCIDSASATSAPADDIEGDARPYDVGGLGDDVDDYDMGADEYVP